MFTELLPADNYAARRDQEMNGDNGGTVFN